MSKESSDEITGTLNNDNIVCYPISSIQMDCRIGHRHVTLYSKLSANTLVHPFYGIADRSGKLYAVMQDLRTSKSLGASLEDPQFTDMRDRLRIAYDIAQTLAYLHSVEILIRSLSDKNILLVQEGSRWKPILTNLDEARLVSPGTSFF